MEIHSFIQPIHVLKNVENKLPVYRVKCFLDVKHNSTSRPSFLPAIIPYDFLRKEYIIHYSSPNNESTLIATNKMGEQHLKPVSKDLGDPFIYSITTSNRPKVCDFYMPGNLRDKSQCISI